MTRHRTTCLLGVELLQAAVVFLTGVAIAAVTAVCFWENHDYVVLSIGGMLTVFLFFAICCRLYSAARRVDDDDDDSIQGDPASGHRIASRGAQGNQQRHSIQLPAVAIAITQLDQSPPAKADGVDTGGANGGGVGFGGGDECVVCLGEVGDDGLATRQLQTCRHVFHKHCIEQWLRAHPTCPICRGNARQESLEVRSSCA